MTRKVLLTVGFTALFTGAFSGAFAQTQSNQQPTAEGQAPQATQQQVAASECAARMEDISGGEFFTGDDAGYRQHLAVLSDLRDSAMQLQAQNLDEACLRVVDAMEIAIESYQGAGAGAGASAAVTTRGDFSREQLEERLVSIDASEMPINTARMEGVDVYSMDGEDIGNVEGFLMSQGKPTHMIVSHGGFWDIGDAEVALPLDIVRWDPEWQTFFAPLTDDQMDEAPDYDAGAWDTGTNDQFYQAFRG